MRFIAWAISGAMVICRTLWPTRMASVARMLSVVTSSVIDEEATRPMAPADGTPLALTDSHSAALAHAMEDELDIASVH